MTLDIAFALNRKLANTLPVVMNSVYCNTAVADQLRFNIVVPEGDETFFTGLLSRCFPDVPFQWRVQGFQPVDPLRAYLAHKYREADAERLRGRHMQFARLWLREIFPDLSRLIYLDTDVVVLQDVQDLDREAGVFTADQFFAAAPHQRPAFLYFNNPLKVLDEVRQMERTFNSGVFITDFSCWTAETYQRIEAYLALDRYYNYKLFGSGDETLLNMVFKNFLPVHPRWNRCGYGNARWVAQLLRCDPATAGVIHWSGGHHKPWNTPDILYGDLWHGYNRFPAIAPETDRSLAPV
jgi:lipopolysaccharide biosynthesis glycosyltransferase